MSYFSLNLQLNLNGMLNRFINTLLKTNIVYVLEDKNGIASLPSIFFNDDNKTAVPVICFWSDHKEARTASNLHWKHCNLSEICLVSFIEDWLINLYNESLIAGLNFNEELDGYEIDPLDLMLAVLREIKKQNLSVEFEYFKNIDDIEKQLHDLINRM